MAEDGYRFAVDHNNFADILLSLAATKALICELNILPKQQRSICQMINVGMATELSILRKALHDHKLELLMELKILLKDYC